MKPNYPIYDLEIDRLYARSALRTGHGELVDLGLGVSGFAVSEHVDMTPEPSDLNLVQKYGDFAGLPILREGIARYYSKLTGVEVSSDRIIVTDGASGAMLLAYLLLLQPDDEILLPAICYPPAAILAYLINARSTPIPLNADGVIDVDALRALKSSHTRAVQINSPSNPFGVTTPDSVFEKVVELGFSIVSDEAYLPLSGRAKSALVFDDRALVLGTMSKAFAAPGLRVGFLIAPKPQMNLLINLHATTSIATSTLSQAIACKLLRQADEVITKHREYLDRSHECLLEVAEKEGVPLVKPERGSFFSVINLEGVPGRTFDLAERLLVDYGVLTAPGTDFGSDHLKFLRINCAQKPDTLREGLRRIGSFLRKQRDSESLYKA